MAPAEPDPPPWWVHVAVAVMSLLGLLLVAWLTVPREF